MAWDSEIVTMVRYLIGDISTTSPTYSDDTLITTILIAATYVQQENRFKATYATNLDNQTLTPDPTVSSNRDDSFLWLVTLKVLCMIANSELKISGGQAISIIDEGSAISLKGILLGKKEVVKQFCGDYKQAAWDYRLNAAPMGQGIFGPFSMAYAQGYYQRDRPSLF